MKSLRTFICIDVLVVITSTSFFYSDVNGMFEPNKLIITIFDHSAERLSEKSAVAKFPTEKSEAENRAQYQPSETENRNMSPHRRHTCLCGKGTPSPRGLRSVNDRYRATESKMKDKALRNQNKMRNENEDTTRNERGQEDRIVNGYRADSKPWMASFGSIQGGVLQASCGGALINHRFVL